MEISQELKLQRILSAEWKKYSGKPKPVWLSLKGVIKKNVNKNRWDIEFAVNDKVLFSIVNLRIFGVPTKFQKRFIGPFKITAKVSRNAYTFKFLEQWKLHPTFHVRLLKPWKSSEFTADESIPKDLTFKMGDDDVLWAIEKLLRWR